MQIYRIICRYIKLSDIEQMCGLLPNEKVNLQLLNIQKEVNRIAT